MKRLITIKAKGSIPFGGTRLKQPRGCMDDLPEYKTVLTSTSEDKGG